MATITEMQEAITNLINSDETIEIPGLDFESVIDHLVDERYKDVLKNASNEEERKQLKNNLLNYYRNQGRMVVDESINTIKSCYSQAKEGLKQVSEAAAQAVASNAIPAVIPIGTANPAYALIENANKKATLLSMLKSIGDALVRLLSSAIKIAFQVPDMVMSLVQTLTTTKQVVNSIPV